MPRSLRVIAAIAAAATKPVAQSKFFESNLAGLRSILAVTFGGMTLDQLASFLRSHKLVVEVFHASASNVDRFREVARATLAEPKQFLIVNYDRKRVGQTGPGYISPVGAYSPEAADRLLIMDVSAYKYPHTRVTVQDLWAAMDTVDPDSTQTRGYLIVRGKE